LNVEAADARPAATEFACAACAGTTSQATGEAGEASLPGTACVVDYLPSWNFAIAENWILSCLVARKRGVVVF
jgi:hypothetical protein